MMEFKAYLKQEIKRPVFALIETVKFTAKFICVSILRLILWGFLFILPILVSLLVCFHWTTEKTRETFGGTSQAYQRGMRPAGSESSNSLLSLTTLSRDLRFWVIELERLKK